MAPDPKPARRIVDQDARKRKLLADTTCRICDEAAANGHHLIPRSAGGDDVEANIIPLCGSGTTGCHGKIESYDYEARHTLARRLHEDEIAYVVQKLVYPNAPDRGYAWLERCYYTRKELVGVDC